ncbi:MAG: metallophosphoesterase family protein [Thermodesulfobacteriota bacterium]
MKIINIADIHGNARPIADMGDIISSADLILLSGDITHFGGEKEASEIIDQIQAFNPNILAVTGNCDNKDVDYYLDQEHMQIQGRAIEIDGVTIFGAGGSLPCPKPTPNIYTEDEYAEIYDPIRGLIPNNKPKILVSHNPPINTLNDTLATGGHVGGKVVRELIERTQPLVCFTGHIHEAAGIDEIGRTKIVNPGPLGTRSYAYLELNDNIETLEIRKI